MSATLPVEDSERAASAQRSRKKGVFLIIGGVAVLGAIAWGAHWWTVGRYIESTDDAYLQADGMTVAPKVSGYVADVLVGDNQSVKRGEPLVRLDSRQYDAVLEQANATIAARRADILRGEAELAQQQAAIAQARAQLDGASANEAHAADQVRRYEPLAATGAETGERVAELRNSQRQASATRAADAAALQSAERQIATTHAAIEQARAQLAAAEASARQAQLDTQDTVLKSPIDGRVGDRSVRVGQYAQPGSRFMTIVPVQDVYLVANFKETQIGMMRVGQPVTLRVDALPGAKLHGRIDSLSPGTGSQFALLPAQNATGNFTKIVQRVPVRIRLDVGQETRKVLLPGLSVNVDVDTRGARDNEARIERENGRG
ncbi:HlyD family secretion protein [Paraburkholderia caribensis]|uniref:HlyD family secretion protein n=1 Tax=Paraburkholderia caribensis TaxID=75105 RepID=A0A9Q6WPA4_9BURK|nr:HlyD family secretion protein [Paraburkholderia caribensis]MCO4882136.1 HlyD family secretion protein [Paraburkholderia caribensis]PTB25874.1 multidrug ABC transporter permease [Paraburkholderia caribensis]QLB65987.1 multidrug ABC transporter permease [Paraburkholderia caribensis]